jgi:uncharacterized protein
MLFLDTSFFVSIIAKTDTLHVLSMEKVSELKDAEFITTEFVLLETANYFCKPFWRTKFIDFLNHDELIELFTTIIPASSDLFHEALDLYAKRPDQSWSLVDCTNFVVMSQFKIQEALTADRHFTQAGFQALLVQPEA